MKNKEYIRKRAEHNVPVDFLLIGRGPNKNVQVWVIAAALLLDKIDEMITDTDLIKVDSSTDTWTWKGGTFRTWPQFHRVTGLAPIEARIETEIPWTTKANRPLSWQEFEKLCAKLVKGKHTGQDARFTRISPDVVQYSVNGKPVKEFECKSVNGQFSNNKYNAEKR